MPIVWRSGRLKLLKSYELVQGLFYLLFSGGKGGRQVWLTTLAHSYADCLEMWET